MNLNVMIQHLKRKAIDLFIMIEIIYFIESISCIDLYGKYDRLY
jgi:hypothetical protein